MYSATLAAFGEALAAVSTAVAALLADEATAECSQATLQTTTTASGLSRWWLLLVLHLLLRGRVVIVAALGRSVGLLRILRVSLRRAVILGRALLVILLRRHFELCLDNESDRIVCSYKAWDSDRYEEGDA
jgi:hypothetical protein